MAVRVSPESPRLGQPDLRRQAVTRVMFGPAIAVRVVNDPYGSVFALACAGVRDRDAGRHSVFAHAVAKLQPQSLAALARVVGSDTSLSPDCLAPVVNVSEPKTSAHAVMISHLDRLRSLTTAEIDDDLDRTFAGTLPQRWEVIRSNSRTWLQHAADGLEELWTVVEPEWQRQHLLRDHEVRRLGHASVNGTLDVELASAHPRGRALDSGFEFPDPDGTEAHIGGRILLLNPLLAGLHLAVSNLDRVDHVYFAYPARPIRASTAGRQKLLVLLSAPRAALLELTTVDHHSMSYLANATHLTPGSTTHHIGWLERCGLVQRYRDGRTIRVAQTNRGRHLLALYTE